MNTRPARTRAQRAAALLLDAWSETIERGDPYYSPWFSLRGAGYELRETA